MPLKPLFGRIRTPFQTSPTEETSTSPLTRDSAVSHGHSEEQSFIADHGVGFEELQSESNFTKQESSARKPPEKKFVFPKRYARESTPFRQATSASVSTPIPASTPARSCERWSRKKIITEYLEEPEPVIGASLRALVADWCQSQFVVLSGLAQAVVFAVGILVCIFVISAGITRYFELGPKQLKPVFEQHVRNCTGRADPYAGCFRISETGAVQCYVLQDSENGSAFHYHLPKSFDNRLHWSHVIQSKSGFIFDDLNKALGGNFQTKKANEALDSNVGLIDQYIAHMNTTSAIRQNQASDTGPSRANANWRSHNFLVYQLWASVTNADHVFLTSSCYSDIATASHIQTEFATSLNTLLIHLHRDIVGLGQSSGPRKSHERVHNAISRIDAFIKTTDTEILPSAKLHLVKSARCLQSRKSSLSSAKRWTNLLVQVVLNLFEDGDNASAGPLRQALQHLSPILANFENQIHAVDSLIARMNLHGFDETAIGNASWIGLSHGAVTDPSWDVHKSHSIPVALDAYEQCTAHIIKWEAGLKRILQKAR